MMDDDDDGGDNGGDESPQKYKNLQSNSHINPFKYLNISSSDRAKEAATQRTLKSLIQPFNESRNFDAKTVVKHSNNNTCIKPCLKRRRASDDNQSEYVFINFKKSKPAEDEFRHQQIPNFAECKDKFNLILGSNEGVMATPTNKNKARRVRSRITSPYSRPNSPSKGIFRSELLFFITKCYFCSEHLAKDFNLNQRPDI